MAKARQGPNPQFTAKMNMSPPVTPGTLMDMFENRISSDVWLQVINLKAFEKEGGQGTRYKVAVSDSKYFIQGIISGPAAALAESKAFELNSVVRLTRFTMANTKGRILITIPEISSDDIIKNCPRLGAPVNFETVVNNNASSAPASSAPVVNAAAPASIPTLNIATPASSAPVAQTYPAAPSMKAQPVSQPNLPANIQTIDSLTPYKDRNQIRARVTSKSQIKKWTNDRGEGRLFSVTFLDHTGEIRMTCFNDVADKYFDLLQENKVYDVSNFQVKLAKRQYGGSVQNDYEIAADAHTVVTAVLDDSISHLPTIHYAFTPIAQIAEKNKDEVLDVIGVVKECGELQQITAKTTQRQLTKRDVTILDSSRSAIKVTFWGKQAEEFSEAQAASNPVLAIKGARVNEYQGRTLSVGDSCKLVINPDIPESHHLRGWFDANRAELASAQLNNVSSANQASADRPMRDDRKFLSQIKDANLGSNEKPDWFSVLASVSYIKGDNANISYMACPTEGCNKKVIEEGPNQYRCERCQKVFDRCDHRYIMTLQISDSTGSTWAQAFNDTGPQIIGKSAEEMYHLKMQDEPAFQQALKDCNFKTFLFKIRAKQEVYQGESRARMNIVSATPVDFDRDAKALISKLSQNM